MIEKITNILSYLYYNIFNKEQIFYYKKIVNQYNNKNFNYRDYQMDKLTKLFSITKNIPLYKDYKCERMEDIKSLPILNKDTIRENKDLLVNKNYIDKNNVFSNFSGGSTGEPVEILQTKYQNLKGISNYYFALYTNGITPYDRSINLWGAVRDMYKPSKKNNLKNIISNRMDLNTFYLDDNIIIDYINKMNSYKPKFIKAYVHSIYDISKYILDNNIKINFTPVIHCTTGPLYPEMRTIIKKAFNDAHVYNFYGSREVSAIAAEDINETHLNVLFDNVYVEIVDENGNEVKYGEEGEVLITTLNNFYMPLIRYRIGDRAIKGDDLKYNSNKINTIIGRTLGVIYKNEKSKIDGQFFVMLFYNKKGIKNFQLVQHNLENFTLKIVKSNSFNENELNEIVSEIKKNLSPNVQINVSFQESIDLTSTGKKMYVFSEINL